MTERNPMIPQPRYPAALFAQDAQPHSTARIGSQPIALAAVTLCVILGGVASIAVWRTYTGTTPELDRVVATRVQMQARATQASEQLFEKTRGLEATQQESIDQLQVAQDQLQTMRRLLAAQQAETRRLSEQVAALSEAVDGLRQSYASAQETSSPVSRNRAIRTRAHVVRVHQRRAKSQG